MLMDGKVALITGASVGIGRAVALLMAQKGMKLALLDIDGIKLDSLRNELGNQTEVFTYVCDVSDEESLRTGIAEAACTLGTVDILVNSAAIWREWSYFVDQNMDIWRRLFEINVTGTAVACQAVLPGMIQQGWGRIINVASVAGVYGNAKMACYSATKGAVISFTKALAKEVGPSCIRVNCVSPGMIDTEMNSAVSDEARESIAGDTPLCRTGRPEEVAAVISFLASDEAGFMTGQVLGVNGGLVI
jgi:3-oxoacyl-[acyl-carrier protein] reductase